MLYFKVWFLGITAFGFAQTTVSFKDIHTETFLPPIKIYQGSTFIAATTEARMRLEDKNAVYRAEADGYYPQEFTLTDFQPTIYLTKINRPYAIISSDSIKSLLREFYDFSKNSVLPKHYYEKYSYDKVNGYGILASDSTKRSTINPKENEYLDYLHEQIYSYEKPQTAKKVFYQKNAGISKTSFKDFVRSNFSPDFLEKPEITIGTSTFLNPLAQEQVQNFNYYPLMTTLHETHLYFQSDSYYGTIIFRKNSPSTLRIFRKQSVGVSSLKVDFSNTTLPDNIQYKFTDKNAEPSIIYLEIKKLTPGEFSWLDYQNIEELPPKNWEEIALQQRKNTKELATFEWEEKMQKRQKLLTFLNNLLEKQKIIVGKFQFNPFDVLSYNGYEGVRLQLGGAYLATKKLKIEGYAAYGFQDKTYKGGAALEYTFNESTKPALRLSYRDDVHPVGRFLSHDTFSQNGFISQITNFNYDLFFHQRIITASFSNEYIDKLANSIAVSYQWVEPKFNYLYKNELDYASYSLFTTNARLLWSPNKKIAKTNYGKVTLKDEPPYIGMDIEKSWKLFSSSFDFTKLTLNATYGRRTFKGETHFLLKAGWIIGNAPLTHLYEGMGTAKNRSGIFQHWGVASENVFETMVPGTFFSDVFTSLQFTHTFDGIRVFKKKYAIALLYRGLIGGMSQTNKNNNTTFLFDTPTELYQEVGLELPGLLFNRMIGIGTYYRIGHYSAKSFDENFFLKVTFDLPKW